MSDAVRYILDQNWSDSEELVSFLDGQYFELHTVEDRKFMYWRLAVSIQNKDDLDILNAYF